MLPLITLRLQNQLLVQPPFDAPQQVVEWMGAVQAQDYRMAKWAVGCRTASTDATQIEAALNRGDILRTHLLRPTWHFVSSKDLRWMLSLTADRIRAANDSYARGTDAALDSKSIHRYMNLLQKTLEGNKHRTKEEIGEALNQRGIPLSQYALRHLLMRAETDGIVCSGADKKGTATYALLDERAPHGEEPSREEALARLARIYFRSHSPATLADFTWWSGLTATEARRAVASIAEELTTEHFGDREFFVFRNAAAAAPCDTTHLLPAYDQYLIGYKDRSGVLAKEHTSKAFNSHGIFQPVILCDGQIVGNWKRTAGRGNVTIQTTLWVNAVPKHWMPPSHGTVRSSAEQSRKTVRRLCEIMITFAGDITQDSSENNERKLETGNADLPATGRTGQLRRHPRRI